MTNDTPDVTTSLAKDSVPEQNGVEEGIALVLNAEDHGDWKPVVDWLTRNPAAAGEVADFLAVQRRLRPSVKWAPAPSPAGTVRGMELKEEVGRGGMGVVYRAFDPVLKWEVAVKMVRPGTTLSPTELARFRFEAETVAGLDHPNIVRVLSFGDAAGAPYLVMPLMTGGSLAQRLKDLGSARMPPKEAARLVRDVARGVHHAHQRGLIHRDLKPGNILLNRDGVPHVADFGLARPLDVNESVSGHIAGTPAYMAPEQARGEKGLTTAVDVHALGAILFELLTGRTPFGGGDVPSVLRRVAEDTAPPVRQFRPDADRDLEAVCMKCLEKSPAARYASAQELADDLDRYLRHEPVTACPPGFWDWLRQLARTAPDPRPNPSWPVTAWFGLTILVANVGIYGMVRWGAPAAGVWAVNLACAAGMLLVLWWYMLRRFRQIPVTDRHSLIIAAGSVLVYFPLMAAYVPLSLSAPAGDGLGLFPTLAACSGLGLFTLGSTYWSRFFPIGLGMMALVPVLTRWPEESPLVYGVVLAAVMWYWSHAKRGGYGSASPD